MMIFGGYNGDEKLTLRDFALFDMLLGQWIKVKQPKQNKTFIEATAFHSMTMIVEPGTPKSVTESRLSWIMNPS